MSLIARKFRAISIAALFALSLLAGAAVTVQAQSWPDPYYGRSSKEQRKWEKEQEKRRRKEQKEWEKRQREYEKESRKARERRERDGYYDDYEYDRYGRRDDRDYGYGRGGDAELGRAAYERGVRDGLRAGSSDRANGRQYDYDDHSAYRNAGYNDRYGRSGEYEDNYRDGFKRGYDEGYRRGDTNRRRDSGWGRILGEILGRP